MKLNNLGIGFAISLFIFGPILLFVFEPETRFNYRAPEKESNSASKPEAAMSLKSIKGLPSQRVTAVAFGENNEIFWGTALGLSRSDREGNEFIVLALGESGENLSVTSLAAYKNFVYVGTSVGYEEFNKNPLSPLFVSKDSGRSFQRIDLAEEFNYREVETLEVNSRGDLYVSVGSKFIVSVNGGASFTEVKFLESPSK